MKKIFFFVLAAFLGISQLSKADDVTASVAKVKFNYCFTTYTDEALTLGKDLLGHYQWEGNTCVSGTNEYLKLDGQNERGCDHYKRMTLTVDDNSEVKDVAINVFSNVFDNGNVYKYPSNENVTFAQSDLDANNQAVKYNCILRPDDQTNDILERITLTVKNVPTGAIAGLFTINADGDQVMFSQGNLQYQASTGTFQFAANQYDIIGNKAGNTTSANRTTQSNWIDMFRWGTSGASDAMYPCKYSSDGNEYFMKVDNKGIEASLTGEYAQYDWGVSNPISNGGNVAGQWRTLTAQEWYYLVNTRDNAADKKSAWCYVKLDGSNKVGGYVLLPDKFQLPEDCSFSTSTNHEYSAAEWSKMEAAGAVFFPAAGWQSGSNLNSFSDSGVAVGCIFWTASNIYDGTGYGNCAYVYSLGASQVNNSTPSGDSKYVLHYLIRCNGALVRLVQDVK